MSPDLARQLGVIGLVVSIGGVALALRSIRSERRIRPALDVARMVVSVVVIVVIASVTDVSANLGLVVLALAAGSTVGFVQGRALNLRADGEALYARHQTMGIVVWGASLVAMQIMVLLNRASILRVGQVVAYFGVAMSLGTFVARTRLIGRTHRVAVATSVAMFTLLLFVLPIVSANISCAAASCAAAGVVGGTGRDPGDTGGGGRGDEGEDEGRGDEGEIDQDRYEGEDEGEDEITGPAIVVPTAAPRPVERQTPNPAAAAVVPSAKPTPTAEPTPTPTLKPVVAPNNVTTAAVQSVANDFTPTAGVGVAAAAAAAGLLVGGLTLAETSLGKGKKLAVLGPSTSTIKGDGEPGSLLSQSASASKANSGLSEATTMHEVPSIYVVGNPDSDAPLDGGSLSDYFDGPPEKAGEDDAPVDPEDIAKWFTGSGGGGDSTSNMQDQLNDLAGNTSDKQDQLNDLAGNTSDKQDQLNDLAGNTSDKQDQLNDLAGNTSDKQDQLNDLADGGNIGMASSNLPDTGGIKGDGGTGINTGTAPPDTGGIKGDGGTGINTGTAPPDTGGIKGDGGVTDPVDKGTKDPDPGEKGSEGNTESGGEKNADPDP